MKDEFESEAAAKSGGGGCRPCCSIPHGMRSLIASILASVAWCFSTTAMNQCHFLTSHFSYCHPPPKAAPLYGSCGDCHCINLNETCPTDPNEIPLTDLPDAWLKQLKTMTPLNGWEMVCNPYNTTGQSCTNPPQDPYQVELWEEAACGIKYNLETVDPTDQCPTEYTMISYDSEDDMIADGATMTHWGACGVCSTTQDLAVYIEYPDLTGKGQECGIRGLIDTNDGIDCFMEVGYTRPCAEMWMYNVFNTRDHCFDVCIDFTFGGTGENNGPPPECRIANCLLCDEQMSGPIFQTEAARSRRRSGLLSKIARPCDVILIVDHQEPCNVTRDLLAQQQQGNSTTRSRALQRPVPPEKWRVPPPKETCVFMQEDLGLLTYADTRSNNFFGDDPLFLTPDQATQTTSYETCYTYDIKNTIEGYWHNMQDILGGAHQAAKAFAIMSTVIGAICLIFAWTSVCIAYSHKFWTRTAGLFALCGLFDFLTMVFFASEVCELGCVFGKSAAFAIVAGVLWWAAAYFSWTTPSYDVEGPPKTTTCCCCPSTVEDTGVYQAVPPPAAGSGGDGGEIPRTEVSIAETVRSDGTTVVEKTTTFPSGAKSVEVTTKRNAVESEKVEAPVDAVDASGNTVEAAMDVDE